MKQTLKILGALILKNNRQPGVLLSGAILILMLIATILNGRYLFPAPVWFAAMAWMLILGTSTGLASFNVDLKSDNIRFLEYLPIRRWHIWAANWIDAMLWLFIALLCTALMPTIQWRPEWVERYGPRLIDPLSHAIFGTRWNLLLGSAGILFCGFGIAAFCRLAFLRDITAMIRAILTAMFLTVAVWGIPMVFGIGPSLRDAAAPLLINGVIFSLLSAGLFMLIPREWGKFRSLLLIRVPAFILGSAVALGVIFLFSRSWIHPSDLQPSGVEVIRSSDGKPTLVVYAESPRSGAHTYTMPATLDRMNYLGRGVHLQTSPNPLPGAWVICNAQFRADNFWPASQRIVSSTLDGADQHTLSAGTTFYDDDYEPRFVNIQPAGRFFTAFTRRTKSSPQQRLVVLDHDGKMIDELPNVIPTYLRVSADGTIFAGKEPPVSDSPDGATQCFLYHPETRTQESLTLPGRVLYIARDLSRVICVRTQSTAKETRQSLELVEVPSLKSRQLVDASELSPIPKLQPQGDAALAAPYSGDRVSVIGSRLVQNEYGFTLLADDELDHLVLQRSDWKGDHLELDLKYFDLRANSSKTLYHGPSHAEEMLSFTPDRKAFLYRTASQVHRMSLPGGETKLLADAPTGNDSLRLELSPDQERVLAVSTRFGPETPISVQQVWQEGRLVFSQQSDSSEIKWLDDNRLVWSDSNGVHVCNFDGSQPRLIFPSR